MEERIKYLLRRHIDQLSTQEEEDELKHLIRTNLYEENVKNDIEQHLQSEDIKYESEFITTFPDTLYNKIKHRIKTSEQKRIKRSWNIMKYAAVVFFAFGIGWWMYPKYSAQRIVGIEDQLDNKSIFKFKNKNFIHLPDGSTVVLNSGSELTYEESYGNNNREVILVGEAFFNVKPDSLHPFLVHTGKIITKVLGTSFNVNAGNEQIVVTVSRGLVEVGEKDKIYSEIKADEQLTINTSSYDFSKAIVEVEKELQWKKQALIFDDVTLEETAKIIGERFGIQVIIQNEDIKKCRIKAWFLDDESVEEILEMVYGTRQATYILEGDKAVISGGIGGC